jgi:anhydro-N-acetylmuramic acid kinase
MPSLLSALGIISGTSMDAIDVALLRTDGQELIECGPTGAFAYPEALRRALQAVIADPPRAEHGDLAEIERQVTAAHVAAAREFLGQHPGLRVDVAGFHGQTVFHAPQRRLTRQLFDGAAGARALGIDVVCRFRHADVAAGGQGAPLVPLYHRALAARLDQPLMVLNLGGVANVTYIDGETLLAFDTGPASALIDDFMLRRRGVPFDRDGALAASGAVDPGVLAALMNNPFFAAAPPKSLDRNDFHRRAAVVEPLSDADGAATLTAFTVEATVSALRHLPRPPARWLVTGGGRLNLAIMRRFAARLGVPVEPVEAVGWDGDGLEAQCFAWLAVRSLKGLPLSLPATTGVPRPMPGGEVSRAGA